MLSQLKATTTPTREAYQRHCKMQEMLWKLDELDSAYSAYTQNLHDMDAETFEACYALTCSQHMALWEARYSKAEEIRFMESELKTAENRRYTMKELLAMGDGLEHHYAKILSAYQQHVESERVYSTLGAFQDEEGEKSGGRTTGEKMAKTMQLKVGGLYSLDSVHSSDLDSHYIDLDPVADSTDDSNDFLIYGGHGRASRG
jgi:hypothetical protein